METKNTSVLQMLVKLDNEEVSMDLSEDMLINVANINESYIDQPAKYAYWATLATLIRSKANKLKQQIDREQDYIKTTLTGSLDGKVRQQLELDGEKITETKVTNAIFVHPEYISHKEKLADLQEQFIAADEQARLLEVGRDTMNQRKEMLISLGAQLRNDYDGTSDFWVKNSEEQSDSDAVDIAAVREVVGRKKAQRTTRKAIRTTGSEENE